MLLIRHAESLWNIRKTDDLDSDLSELGIQTVTKTANYLKDNFNFSEYNCLTSPYLRTLRTSQIIANICNVDFEVDSSVREHHVGAGGPSHYMEIPIRREFKFKWDADFEFETTDNTLFFENRDLSELVYDLELFLDAVGSKTIIVSHAVPIKIMSDLLIGTNPEQLINDYSKDQSLMLGKIKNSSLTLIENGKIEYFSKIVF